MNFVSEIIIRKKNLSNIKNIATQTISNVVNKKNDNVDFTTAIDYPKYTTIDRFKASMIRLLLKQNKYMMFPFFSGLFFTFSLKKYI